MSSNELSTFMGLCLLITIVVCLMLIAYEDGIPFSLLNKLKCKLGYHNVYNRFRKINIYYCKFCKKPRKHPELKVLDGGRKIGDNKFRF